MNKHVKNDIASKWEELGVQLLDEEQRKMLKNIEKNESDVQSCCTKLFDHWLTVDVHASWNKLIEALKEIDENHLAVKIRRKILKLKGTVATPFLH